MAKRRAAKVAKSKGRENAGVPERIQCCPYGNLMKSFVPFSFCAVAMVLYVVVCFSCSTFKVELASKDKTSTQNQELNGGVAVAVRQDDTFLIGYWRVEVLNSLGIKTCEFIDDVVDFNIDSVYMAGRAFTVIGTALGVALFHFYLLLACVSFPPTMVRVGAAFSFVMAAVTAVTMCLGLGTGMWDYVSMRITPGPAGYCGVASFFSWIAAGISLLVLVVPNATPWSPKRPDYGDDEDDIEATDLLVRSDGDDDEDYDGDDDDGARDGEETRTVIEIVRNPDGTSTKIITRYATDADGVSRVLGKTMEVEEEVKEEEEGDDVEKFHFQ